jgi:hypothetical protein
MGILFAFRCPLGKTLSQTQQYLNIFGLLITSAEVKGCEAVITIAPFGLIARFNCSHINGKSITVSHLQAVVP